jgi:hypothetical protein
LRTRVKRGNSFNHGLGIYLPENSEEAFQPFDCDLDLDLSQ